MNFRKNLFTFFGILFITTGLYSSEILTDREAWLKDKDFIDGILYLEGKKGTETLKKEVSNCPYDKCEAVNINKESFEAIKVIEITKVDYKNAIKSLYRSVQNNNLLAAERLIKFLKGRVDYKSHKQNDFLINRLKEELGLNFKQYKEIFIQSAELGYKIKKGCVSSYVFGEINELGLLGFDKDLEKAKESYLISFNKCNNTSFYKIMAKKRLNSVK